MPNLSFKDILDRKNLNKNVKYIVPNYKALEKKLVIKVKKGNDEENKNEENLNNKENTNKSSETKENKDNEDNYDISVNYNPNTNNDKNKKDNKDNKDNDDFDFGNYDGEFTIEPFL